MSAEVVTGIALEVRCERCGGRGCFRECGAASACPSCGGAGYIPTDAGKQILSLLRHNLENIRRELRELD
jgi:hypothetical protein